MVMTSMHQRGVVGAYKYRAVLLDPIHGFIPVNTAEYSILQTPFLRRLHNITQLGLTFLVYPGARHSRFEHSIGVMHLMGRFAEKLSSAMQEDNDICLSITSSCSTRELRNFIQVSRLTGLLHDVGHLPFSHQLEIALNELYREKPDLFPWMGNVKTKIHEHYTLHYINRIKEAYTKPRSKLRYILQAVEDVITPKKRPDREAMNKLGLKAGAYDVIRQLISGTIDADRLDYVMRDSYHAGVVYGRVDTDRLIYALTVDLVNGKPRAIYDVKGLSALEDMFDSRVKMYKWLYFHHKNTAFYIALAKIVRSLKDKWDLIVSKIYPHLGNIGFSELFDPIVLTDLIASSKIMFDENEFMAMVYMLRNTGDSVAERWASSIAERRELLPISIVKRSGDLVLYMEGRPPDTIKRLSRLMSDEISVKRLEDEIKQYYIEAYGDRLREECGIYPSQASFVVSSYSIEKGALKRDLKVKGVRVFELAGVSSHVRGIHVAASDPIIYVHAYSDDECEHLFMRRLEEDLKRVVVKLFEKTL